MSLEGRGWGEIEDRVNRWMIEGQVDEYFRKKVYMSERLFSREQ